MTSLNIFHKLRSRRGQATTEVVLLFPLFFILTLFIIKIYGLLIVVQKAEIAASYAGRRWMFESHRAQQYHQWDRNFLQRDIERKVQDFIGYNNQSQRKFLSLRGVKLEIERTNVWNVLTLTINTHPVRIPLLCAYDKRIVCQYPYGTACMRGYRYICEDGGTIEVIKNVVNRDRPISFILPGSAAPM